jgi:hypothetical protein
MPELKFDKKVCMQCETVDSLMKCQHLGFDLLTQLKERIRP